MPAVIQVRRGQAATWASINPILSPGEFGYETDTGKTKLGNGNTAWNSLAYLPTTAESASAAATTLARRDGDANLTANSFISSTATTTTSAGTTTLTIASAQVQVFTGTSTHTVKLPTTSVTAGQSYIIANRSTGAVTVQSSGGNTVATVAASTVGVFYAMQDTPTAAAHWKNAAGGGGIGSYVQSVGDGSSTSITVTHNLNTRNVVVSVKDAATYVEVMCDITASSANTVTLGFGTAPTTNQYIVTILADGAPVASANTAPYADNQFSLSAAADITKVLNFSLAGLSTGTTRTVTVPDANLTLVGTTTSQALTNKDLSSGTNTFPAALLTASGSATLTNKDLTSGTNTFPASFATLTGSQAFTNKDLTSATNTFPSSLVTLTGAQALSSKTLTNPTITGYTESVNAIGTVTSTSTLSLSSGTVLTATLTASTTCTFTMPTAVAGQSFVLMLKQAASTGNGSATFTGVKWGTAGAPTITTAAGKMDIVSFFSDGTNWYGSIAQGYTP